MTDNIQKALLPPNWRVNSYVQVFCQNMHTNPLSIQEEENYLFIQSTEFLISHAFSINRGKLFKRTCWNHFVSSIQTWIVQSFILIASSIQSLSCLPIGKSETFSVTHQSYLFSNHVLVLQLDMLALAFPLAFEFLALLTTCPNRILRKKGPLVIEKFFCLPQTC